MGLKTAVANLVAFLLFAVAGLSVVYFGLNVVRITLQGVTGVRVVATLFSAGLAMTAGFFGYFTRKYIAGNVLPVDYDVSVAFRGGRGGL